MHYHFKFNVKVREERPVIAADRTDDATSTGSALTSPFGDSRISGVSPILYFELVDFACIG